MASESEDRTALAEDRTDLAVDRTLLANERTFSGWMRTGLAALGMGLAFHALFNRLEPTWLPKSIATLFILSALIIYQTAKKKSCEVIDRLNASQVSPFPTRSTKLIAHLMSLGAICLLIAVWFLDWSV
ncbi:MAG: DUF202 domain-containing protein [Acidimicrobiales bacterium]|nr:DUF202 domain-containing protein [Hyphomonadaceae bacterium]RZV44514.1 MAG: DUF202 domain-containing protein [Acidimicrobiales bacterium]